MPTTFIGLRHLIALLLLRCLYPIAMREAQAAVVLPLRGEALSPMGSAYRWVVSSETQPLSVDPAHPSRSALFLERWNQPTVFLLSKRAPFKR